MFEPDPDDELPHWTDGFTAEDWAAFVADMNALPPDLPTDEEIDEMCRRAGYDRPPF